MQELEREVVDDGDRRHGQDDEDDNHPHRQLGARSPFTCLAEQSVQIAGNQRSEAEQRDGVEREQRRVELAEPGGILGGDAHQVGRTEQYHAETDDRPDALAESAHRSIRHSNHPLFSRHCGLR